MLHINLLYFYDRERIKSFNASSHEDVDSNAGQRTGIFWAPVKDPEKIAKGDDIHVFYVHLTGNI